MYSIGPKKGEFATAVFPSAHLALLQTRVDHRHSRESKDSFWREKELTEDMPSSFTTEFPLNRYAPIALTVAKWMEHNVEEKTITTS